MKITATFMCAALTLMLGGCYPTGNTAESSIPDYLSDAESQTQTSLSSGQPDNNSSTDSSEDSVPDAEIYLELENVIVDLKLPENIDSATAVQITPKQWNDDVISELFLSDKANYEHTEYQSDYYDGKTVKYYSDNSDFSLSSEAGMINYTDLQSTSYNYSLIATAWHYDNMSELFGSDELADFPISEAQEQIDTYLEKLGIDNLEKAEIYSVSADEANAYFATFGDIVDKNGNAFGGWTDAQQCYVLLYHQTFNGIEFSEYNDNRILAVVTKEKLISFSCSRIFDITENAADSMNIEFDSREALNMVIDRYEQMILEVPVRIVDCKAVYFPVCINKTENYECDIAWEFELILSPDGEEYYSRHYVNAATGELL